MKKLRAFLLICAMLVLLTSCAKNDTVKECEKHIYGEWQVVLKETCTNEGRMNRKCSYCDAEETQITAPSEHAWREWTMTMAPACEDNGEETRECKDCGAKETRVLPMLYHSMSDWKIGHEATCTEEGEWIMACARCDYALTEPIAAIGHKLGDWATEKDAGCTENGTAMRACQNCELEETKILDALGHDTEGIRCDRCRTYFAEPSSFWEYYRFEEEFFIWVYGYSIVKKDTEKVVRVTYEENQHVIYSGEDSANPVMKNGVLVLISESGDHYLGTMENGVCEFHVPVDAKIKYMEYDVDAIYAYGTQGMLNYDEGDYYWLIDDN